MSIGGQNFKYLLVQQIKKTKSLNESDFRILILKFTAQVFNSTFNISSQHQYNFKFINHDY